MILVRTNKNALRVWKKGIKESCFYVKKVVNF